MPITIIRAPLIFFIAASIIFTACQQRSKAMSFYYWRTNFHLDTTEQQAITTNHINLLYTRYFDVDFAPADSAPIAVASVVFGRIPAIPVLPVVYIKNRTFDRLTRAGIDSLSQKIYQLVSGINRSIQQDPVAIQFDCDWTETSKDKYFEFLHQYRQHSKKIISATIRLHQVKYASRTGIPPVDYGVLMYYNMGDIKAETNNSIYDKSIAARYNPSIKTYPLVLDVALPIFAWGLQVRDGKVIKLLNKMNFLHFEKDTNFTRAGNVRFAAVHNCFHGGYYFQANDIVKTEHVTESDLLEIVAQVNRYSNHRIRNIIFYDLDQENLMLYEKNVFKKILDRLD